MRRSLKTTVTGVLILAVPAGLDAWQWRAHAAHKTAFCPTAITRGDLHATIAATETLEPEEVV
jgi:hypothetical protein